MFLRQQGFANKKRAFSNLWRDVKKVHEEWNVRKKGKLKKV